ncbi:caspase family protein [Bradyrhizobium manausense]|uniref:caspase family protein n=1 Tax=Bradyrhizobium manausense TaxID=989370 RepID=UPI001BA67743|nr:caspase family protein [Bradyrhizobium manausense]MBR0689852.1 caspase family protein [Bradyrhizobium manausense]
MTARRIIAVIAGSLSLLSMFCCSEVAVGGDAKSCWILDSSDKSIAASMNIRVDQGAHIRAGEPLQFRFNAPQLKSGCDSAFYLVLTFPEKVRFDGEGFFVVPKSVKGPFDVPYKTDRTRLFVPLHGEFIPGERVVGVRPLSLGQLEADWALMEVPSDRNGFITSAAIEVPLGGLSVMVTAGRQRIEVRDHFSLDAPKRRIASNSGEFLLEDFGAYYRVLDRATDTLVIERDGDSPNFSPTSRFVAAFRLDHQSVEIVDLFAGRVVGTLGNRGAAGDYTRIHVVAWGMRDAIVIGGMASYASGDLLQTSIDRGPTHFFNTGLSSFAWSDAGIVVSLENASFISYNFERKAADTDSCFGPNNWSVTSLLFSGAPDNGNNGQDDNLSKQIQKLTLSQLLVGKCGPKSPVIGRNWDVGGNVMLSHATNLDRFPGLSKQAQGQTASLVAHHTIVALDQSSSSSSASLLKGRLAVNRDVFVGDRMVRAKGDSFGKISDFFIARYQFGLQKGRPGNESDFDTSSKTHDTRVGALQQSILKVDAKAGSFWTADFDNCSSDEEQIHVPNVLKAWQWSIEGKQVWLIYHYCETMNSGNNHLAKLYLLRGQNNKVEMTKLLELSDVVPVTARILSNRILAVSGAQREVVLFDLDQMRQTVRFDGISGGDITSEFGASNDNNWFVYVSANGDFGLISTVNKARLYGRFIDDEIVVYTSQGYYDATTEGANFVFARFPGIIGYFTLEQLSQKLRRPDFISDVLHNSGRQESQPSLLPPPSVAITGNQGEGEGRILRLTVGLHADAGLANLTVYRDGALVRNEQQGGIDSELRMQIPLTGSTRWVTVQAEDGQGLKSSPQAIMLKPIGQQKSGSLYALASGTDAYLNKNIPPLKFAVSDARRFIEFVKRAAPRAYENVEADVLSNTQDFKSEILGRLKALADKTRDQDTTMLFFAGHGVRDGSGRFYLAGPKTDLSNPADGSMAWDEMSDAIRSMKGRVLVFVDACHSGAIDEQLPTNDDAVGAILKKDVALAVMAASKGRQQSKERSDQGGGVFTTALISALGNRSSTDTNSNGSIELSELYRSVKRYVSDATGGDQTPWIARNQLVGEVPLF